MTIHLETQSDLEDAVHALIKLDPRLQPIFALTGMPALRRREPGFAGLAHIVCGQQVSTASAAAIWGRVSAAFDPFHHDALRKARTDRLGRLGLSGAKIKTLKNLAREIASERLNLDVLANEDADAAHNTLTALHGIGPWTADVYLCSASAMATPGRPAISPYRKRSRSASACRPGRPRNRWRRWRSHGGRCAVRRRICGGAITAC